MSKRKRRANDLVSEGTTRAKICQSKADAARVVRVDLRGCASTSEALKSYLVNNFPAPISSKAWSIQTDQFPRGCMQVLLDHLADHDISVSRFQNQYGKVYKYHLQNPDLKLLVKAHGTTLTHLQMTPLSEEELPAPKLQGCGYRWTTLHAKQLQVLELSMKYDVKQQLLDFSRRTPLRVDHLQELILRDVGPNATRQQLIELVTRAKTMKKLVLMGMEVEDDPDEEGDLQALLVATAKKAGNAALIVEVK